MAGFVDVNPMDFKRSPFKLIGRENMLIAAENGGKVNAMTAAWGGLGVLWRMNVVYAVIRPERYTHEFVEASDRFSLNFFGSERRDLLGYMGSVSGRDEDKIAKAKLTVAHADNAPYFAEAETAIVCRKLYAQNLEAHCFVDKDQIKQWYSEEAFHTMYIGEIVRILSRQ